MYSRMLVPVDNSEYSNAAVRVAASIAARLGSTVVGFHVYAARLHDTRFQQMEQGLPQRYQEPGELERQRSIHDSLITKGLAMISESYLDAFEAQCRSRGVPFEHKMAEGRNYVEIIRELEGNSYDLAIMGVLGLGAVEGSIIGSVCERVLRKGPTDVLVVKEPSGRAPERVAVGIDGSPYSFMALDRALELGKALGVGVEVMTAFDPNFHVTAFRSIAGVLSDEAAKVFRFQEQERLHEEIINKGLAKLYQEHLERARLMAQERGQEVSTALLSGKPFQQVLKHINGGPLTLLVLGRFGANRREYTDLGSTAENLVRLSRGNVLVVNGEFRPSERRADEQGHAATSVVRPDAEPRHGVSNDPEDVQALTWTAQAEARLAQAPEGMMRDMTKQRVEALARRKGVGCVTLELMEEKYEQWAQGSAQVQTDLSWRPEAQQRMERVPAFVRGMVMKRIEELAQERGLREITSDLIDEAKRLWEDTGSFHR